MNKIAIDLGGITYPVFIENGLISDISGKLTELRAEGSLYFIVDRFIYQAYQRDIETAASGQNGNIFCINAGKSNKTFATAMRIFADLDKRNVSRDVVIVAIGGGVIGDIAGFVASCWYRGVRLIHMPTTVLSAVDSCLGGKTAINFKHTVNAVGTYHHPIAIIIDTDVILNLPDREIASGFGEIVKYSALGATQITQILEQGNKYSVSRIAELIGLSLKVKESFVRNDVAEGSKRLFLNFGHTIGHAIEFATVFNGVESLRHGEGVALGMVAIYRICISLNLLEERDLKRLKTLLTMHRLPVVFNARRIDTSRERLIRKVVQLTLKDKKRTSTHLRLIVLDGWGNPELHITDDPKLISLGVGEVIV